MILCITEKPSVGADIARILGANVRKDGYFEGAGYCVTWTFGHLCCLKDPADYFPQWKKWSMAYLPMIPPKFGIKVMEAPSIRKQMQVIAILISKADKIINCGDAGQEGELIQRWVMQKAECDKPVERLWISSLTDDAIREGFTKLRPQQDLQSLYMAGLCRAVGDWILGINATRLYTLKYAKDRTLLSIGRVQTPTLALIVNRQREIENFVPKDTWELRTRYRDVVFTSEKDPFATQEEGLPVLEHIQQLPFEITAITKKKGKEGPPKLFDLTSLQVEANRRYNMGADQTLKTIQSLYEKKVTTYPRVDTTYLTEDVYKKCGPILNSLQGYQDLLVHLRGKPLRKNKKVFDNSKVTDHHAIIPTGQPLPPGLSDTELKIFHLIARRFVAAFFPDCSFEQTNVKGAAGKYKFKASGKAITDQGWKLVFADEKQDIASSKDSSATMLPPFTIGESGLHSPYLYKKTSQPPKYYTEGTLLKAMETAGSNVEDETLRENLKANGLGRPSTRAEILNKLYDRGYVTAEGKSLRATPAGIQLIDTIKDELLKSPELTGIWEGKLREIERGEYPAATFVDQLKKMIHKITLSVLQDNSRSSIQTLGTDKPKAPKSSKSKTSKTKSTK